MSNNRKPGISRTIKQKAAVALSIVALAADMCAEDPKELQTARNQYKHSSPPTAEPTRQYYISSLVELRDRFAEAKKTKDWQAVDAEIRRHPAPKDSNSRVLSTLLVGEWASPRHEYLYRADGTWTMLPEMTDGLRSTRGSWHIKGNQFFATVGTDSTQALPCTIILLSDQHFIFTDGENVFCETRMNSAPASSVEVGNQHPKTVLDFYKLLPNEDYKHFEGDRRALLSSDDRRVVDVKNAYIYLHGDGGQTDVCLTLFKKPNGRYLVAVANYGGDDYGNALEFYILEDGRLKDVPKSAVMPTGYNKEFRYILPRIGKTIKVVDSSEQIIFELLWTDGRFVKLRK